MLSAKRIGKRLPGLIAYIVVIVAVLLAAGLLVYFTNGLSESFKSFYVKVDGNIILGSADNFVLSADTDPLRVDVRYTFGAFGGDDKSYTVKIVPCAAADNFDFLVNGDVYSFKSVEDLTAGFDLQIFEDYFTIAVPIGGLYSIFSRLFPDTEIEFLADFNYSGDLFTVLVTSFDGSSVCLNFGVYEAVSGLDLDRDEVVVAV